MDCEKSPLKFLMLHWLFIKSHVSFETMCKVQFSGTDFLEISGWVNCYDSLDRGLVYYLLKQNQQK